MENWALSPRVFAVRRYIVTKSVVQKQRLFGVFRDMLEFLLEVSL